MDRCTRTEQIDLQAHTNAHITLLLPCHRTIHWQLGTITLNSGYKGTNFANIDQVYMRIVCVHLPSIWAPPIQSKGLQVIAAMNGAEEPNSPLPGLTRPDCILPQAVCTVLFNEQYTFDYYGSWQPFVATFRSHSSCLKITRVWKYCQLQW